jgi:dinuclear metal center YbgI/SA1388 family protein
MPFENSAEFDNTGILIYGKEEVSKILLTLDITNKVADEAISKNTDLIISHHPLIFKPIKKLHFDDICVNLAKNNISVISAHTNFDLANYGVSDIMCNVLGFENQHECLEIFENKNNYIQNSGNEIGYGRICNCPDISTYELVKLVKEKFKSGIIRYVDSGNINNKIALCSGSGGSSFKIAHSLSCNALITGDVKHDQFIEAKNIGITLIDAGHFHTETICLDYLLKKIKEKFSDLEVEIAENNVDVVEYY